MTAASLRPPAGRREGRRDRAAEFGVPEPLRSGVVLGVLVAVWALLPNVVAKPRYVWPVEGATVVLLLASVAVQRRELRWSAPTGLVSLLSVCMVLSVSTYGMVSDLILGAGVAVMMVGATLLGTNMGPADLRIFVDLVLALAGLQLLLATAEQFAGLAEPWGDLSITGATPSSNPLLTALPLRATGSMGHPIPLGLLMAVAAVLVLFAHRPWRWSVRIPLAVAFTAGLLFSGSRSAVLALPLALLFAALIPLGWRYGGVLRAALLLGATAAFAFGNLQDATVFSSLSNTGSLTHRIGAINAALKLTTRPLRQALFGSGFDSVPDLFDAGYLQDDGFRTVDNQLVTTMALGGTVGLVLLLAAVGYGLARARPAVRPAVVLIGVMFFSFDLLNWFSPMLLFFTLLSLGSAVPERYGSIPGPATAPATEPAAAPEPAPP